MGRSAYHCLKQMGPQSALSPCRKASHPLTPRGPSSAKPPSDADPRIQASLNVARGPALNSSHGPAASSSLQELTTHTTANGVLYLLPTAIHPDFSPSKNDNNRNSPVHYDGWQSFCRPYEGGLPYIRNACKTLNELIMYGCGSSTFHEVTQQSPSTGTSAAPN